MKYDLRGRNQQHFSFIFVHRCLFLQTWKEKYRQPFNDEHASRINRRFEVKDSLCEFCMNSAELNPITDPEFPKMLQSCHLRAAFPPWGSILLEWLGVNTCILGVNWLTLELQKC